MPSSIFEDSESGILVDKTGSERLLVSFGGIKQGLGIPTFEFFNSLSNIHCDKLFLRDFNQAWYQFGVNEEISTIGKIHDYLKAEISGNDYQKTCFIGNSMGGYAAILFGSMLGVKTVISFAPQTFIDQWNRLAALDLRWRRQLKRVHQAETEGTYLDLKKHLERQNYPDTEIFIFYSRDYRLDRVHAERLKGSKNVHLRPLPGGDHSIVKTIRDSGELQRLVSNALL